MKWRSREQEEEEWKGEGRRKEVEEDKVEEAVVAAVMQS